MESKELTANSIESLYSKISKEISKNIGMTKKVNSYFSLNGKDNPINNPTDVNLLPNDRVYFEINTDRNKIFGNIIQGKKKVKAVYEIN
jgi:hypothetical protein